MAWPWRILLICPDNCARLGKVPACHLTCADKLRKLLMKTKNRGQGMRQASVLAALLLSSAMVLTGCDQARQVITGKVEVADSKYPERVFWGDTHLHTSNSPDAFGFGNRLGPEEALRFARGEEVTSSTGIKAKLARPLDFLVVSVIRTVLPRSKTCTTRRGS